MDNPQVTIIIPVASYHTTIVERAIAAVRSQSWPCELVTVLDKDGQGAGATRNRGVALSHTPLVYFLDADDLIRPDAIERVLASYRPGHYVYSDDYQGDSLHQTKDCGAYFDGAWHTISVLISKADFERVGGFNEQLPALEDLDFFMKLQASGICGIRCPHPVMSYSDMGTRSISFIRDVRYQEQKHQIYQRYIEKAKMACNCGATLVTQTPDNKQDGDILVTALYTPMQLPGPITGRLYPRPLGMNGYQIWVDPRDLNHPKGQGLWKPVINAEAVAAPAIDDVLNMAREAGGE